MSLSVIFSPDSHEVFFFFKAVARRSYDARTTFVMSSVAKISHCQFTKILRRQVHDTRTNVARQSSDSLAKCFGEKIHIKF